MTLPARAIIGRLDGACSFRIDVAKWTIRRLKLAVCGNNVLPGTIEPTIAKDAVHCVGIGLWTRSLSGSDGGLR
ncbi:hypothetical protein, partial [Mesorhizobium sp. M2A.F.Ca.ET.039.01.1.1]|uniref:hypothetical protein n=1 Tax=Mesorhizobium sp. M2A.F.Ca.ET.039.01.1.1 TaxID=2496746 RepID=UPI001AECCE15